MLLSKGKTGGCSHGEMTASGGMESFQLKQWEEGQIEREDQKSKVMGVCEPLWRLQPKKPSIRTFPRPCCVVTG